MIWFTRSQPARASLKLAFWAVLSPARFNLQHRMVRSVYKVNFLKWCTYTTKLGLECYKNIKDAREAKQLQKRKIQVNGSDPKAIGSYTGTTLARRSVRLTSNLASKICCRISTIIFSKPVSNIRHRRSGRDTQAFGAESESNKANAPVQGRQSESRQWRYD